MRLFINDINIELADKETIILLERNANVADPGRRAGSYTNDFKAILNPHNATALGYVDDLASISTVKVEKRQGAYLEKEEGSRIKSGFAQIVKVDHREETITITFFSGNTSWIDALKGRSIQDIWTRDLDHLWTEANIVASWSNTGGYIYPFIDYGRLTFQNSSNTFIDDWYPAMFQHTLVTRILENIGWKPSGDVIDSWLYKQTAVPFVNQRFIEETSNETLAEANRTTLQSHDLTRTPVSATSETTTELLEIDTIVKDDLGAFDLAQERYTATKSINDAVFVMTLNNASARVSIGSGSSTTATITLKIQKNGSSVQEITLNTQTADDIDNTVNGPFTISATVDLLAGDYVDCIAEFSYSSAVASTTIIQLVLNAESFTFELSEVNEEIAAGGTVTLSNNLPDIDQAEFIKDIALRHGALLTTDDYTQTLYFNSFENIVNALDEAEDWSERVNMIGVSEIDFTQIVNNYGRKSYFKYSPPGNDDDELLGYNDGRQIAYGDGRLDIDNDFIQGERDIYTSPFTATTQIEAFQGQAFGGVFMPYIPRRDYSGADTLRPNPRLLIVIQDVDIEDFNGDDGASISSVQINGGTIYTETAFSYFSKKRFNSDLDFITDTLSYDTPEDINSGDEGLLTKNYAAWLRILQNPRYIILSMKLWAHEFEFMDLSKPIYINNPEIQGYFMIDEVRFSGGDDLVRLIQVK